MTELFVTGLPFASTEIEISEYFTSMLPQNLQQPDELTIKLQKHDDGRSRGRAFVQFPNKEAATHIFENRKSLELSGRKLYADFTGTSSIFGSKLFVKGLPFSATESDIAALSFFSGCTKVEVLKHDDGRSKGCGYITWPSFEQAEAAFDGRNEAKMGGRRLWLDFTGPRSRFKLRGMNRLKKVRADDGGGSGEIKRAKRDIELSPGNNSSGYSSSSSGVVK